MLLAVRDSEPAGERKPVRGKVNNICQCTLTTTFQPTSRSEPSKRSKWLVTQEQ